MKPGKTQAGSRSKTAAGRSLMFAAGPRMLGMSWGKPEELQMSGKSQATHDYIVFKLGQALQLLLLAQRDTAVQKGYRTSS